MSDPENSENSNDLPEEENELNHEQEFEFEDHSGDVPEDDFETVAQFAERHHLSVTAVREANRDNIDEFGAVHSALRLPE